MTGPWYEQGNVWRKHWFIEFEDPFQRTWFWTRAGAVRAMDNLRETP